MKYLRLAGVLRLHRLCIEKSGGSSGVRDLGLLKSALAQPRMTFGGQELYPTVVEKGAAIAFSIVKNHPFVDGNKRTGHFAMELFLRYNGHEISASVDEQEKIILGLAAGELEREAFTEWLRAHIVPHKAL